ncbi:carbohydrate-binding protein [Pseudomonas abietaniphila]|uniref:carbohydrate-binding protein n=1 Tax=Pseudomonas abietaniphila TaxID=89065 RepID=UPI0007838959|nr:carbohydrate-binding protein [Pseudomonas abietaniphila]
MSRMTIVPPTEITPAMLTSNVPANDYDAWASGTTYAVGAYVTYNNRNYQALGASTGKNPETDASQPPVWQDLGPTNRWKMFKKQIGNDWIVGTSTSYPTVVDVTVALTKRVNAIGLVGVRASSVQIIMKSGGVEVYNNTFQMASKSGGSWYQYYFGPFTTLDNLAVLDLPPIAGATIQVIANAPGGTAQIGMMVVGWANDIGAAVYGDTSFGLENYSNVKIGDFGQITIVPRGKRDFVNYDVVVDEDRLSTIKRTLSGISESAVLYVGSASLDVTVIIGRYERFAPNLRAPNDAQFTLEVRSLT